eukprot:TRINITY_DN34936_c0_g1_i1.p1 TRINITY_DN34936_c0_g1~~TRINITY_DN34936_c0_g1_i1.p1  ORF type:complete len:591 (+),score=88.60 TRINITY_DN34936_c0_g1_i1:57-1775(+)
MNKNTFFPLSSPRGTDVLTLTDLRQELNDFMTSTLQGAFDDLEHNLRGLISAPGHSHFPCSSAASSWNLQSALVRRRHNALDPEALLHRYSLHENGLPEPMPRPPALPEETTLLTERSCHFSAEKASYTPLLSADAVMVHAHLCETPEQLQSVADTRANNHSSQREDTLATENDFAPRSFRQQVQRLVQGESFHQAVIVLLLSNALLVGIETQHFASCESSDELGSCRDGLGRSLRVLESLYCVCFAGELSVRVYAFGTSFFCGDSWAWNLYDFLVVALQVIEQVLQFFVSSSSLHGDMVILQCCRMMRVIRVARLMRMVHLLEELQTLIGSIEAAIETLGWTLFLLFMLLYLTSVFVTQVVISAGETPHAKELRYWFGNLFRTYLTMFECIFGGVSWDAVVAPLAEDISPMLACAFCMYVAFCSLVLMNVATGVFVETALRIAQEDKDNNIANKIRALFFESMSSDHTITFDDFCSKVDSPVMQEYLKSINVDPSETTSLYKLLDSDCSGGVDADEMVRGCLRLKGGAKALDQSLLLYNFSRMDAMLESCNERLETCFDHIQRALQSKPKT